MSAMEDGGPVHPIPALYGPDGHGIYEGWNGMTLRQHMATQAMQALLASGGMFGRGGNMEKLVDATATLSVAFADALLKKLEEAPQS